MPIQRAWVIWINIYKLRLNQRPPFPTPPPKTWGNISSPISLPKDESGFGHKKGGRGPLFGFFNSRQDETRPTERGFKNYLKLHQLV